MKKLRGNLFFKLFLALLIAVCSFSLVFCSAAALLLEGQNYTGEDAVYQNTSATLNLLAEYQFDAWEALRLNYIGDAGYSYLEQRQYAEAVARLETELDAENTNFRYEICTYDGTVVQSNLSEGQQWDRLGCSPATLMEDGTLNYDKGYRYFFYDSYDMYSPDTASSSIPDDEKDDENNGQQLILEFGLATDLSAQDSFLQQAQQFDRYRSAFLPLVAAAAASALVLVAALCLLLSCAGHRSGRDGITLGWFDRLWFDGLLLLYGLSWFGILYLYEAIYYDIYYGYSARNIRVMLLWGSAGAALMAALTLPLLYTFAVRCKSRTLLQGTLCHALGRFVIRLWRWLIRAFHALRLSWRLVICFLAYEFVSLIIRMLLWRSGVSYIALFLLNLALVAVMCLWSQSFQKVKEGGRAMAEGDLNYRIDTARLPPDLKAHAEHLNNISQGMAAAVETQMQSERFKAELITNVSHDLKTPLTSIINYVDLLKKEEISNPTAVEYIQVLDRKSQRLKKLTEDLVEASKASTGALTVNQERIGVTQLVNQAVGEYEEKLAGNQLTVVTSLPEAEVYVNADGRHLWRILDNLLSNCNKYALPGTRVYVDVAKRDGSIHLSVKNISRDPLNIPAEQLMERFVRGDESRTTEGSGLGLSIARSLAELQGGQFQLSIDGDLFKATLILPEIH